MAKTNLSRAEAAFDRAALARICVLPERKFAAAYGMATVQVAQNAPDDFYLFRDNGSSVLAVAHLDTVQLPNRRAARFIQTTAGPMVLSGALDDRLGAYIILELLPKLGITCDWLLTVGEETCASTARFFTPPPGKKYDWMIEFDRGGTDVVMYQYDDEGTRLAVEAAGAMVGEGIFTDICFLEHLGVKGFNWGVGYRQYHSAKSHAYLDETIMMVSRFLQFHDIHAGTAMPHTAHITGDCLLCDPAESVHLYSGTCLACGASQYWMPETSS